MPVVQGDERAISRGPAAMPRDTKRRVLLQALELVGSRQELAELLGAGRAQMDNWLADASEIPEAYFLKAIELCLERSQGSGMPQTPPH